MSAPFAQCPFGMERHGTCEKCAFPKEVAHLPLGDRRQWWHRNETEFDCVSIDIGGLNNALKEDEVGKTLKDVLPPDGSLDGVCVSIAAAKGGKQLLLGRARFYHFEAGGDSVAAFGDVKLANVLRWRGMHQVLISIRVAICTILDIPFNRMIWAPGRHAEKLAAVGFQESELSEVRQHSPELRELAHRSRQENPKLISGLAHVDESMVSKHIDRALTIARQGYIILSGNCKYRGQLTVHLSKELRSLLLWTFDIPPPTAACAG